MEKKIPTQVFLEENEQPKTWYNLLADLEDVEPFLRPDGTPVQPQDLEVLFPKQCIEQEFSRERFIDIPDEVCKVYSTYRATPLHRAYGFEEFLGTPAKLYYKYEGVNPSGSHKLNSAIPQVYYNKINGITKLTTETGAGQWGTALSVASSMFGMECDVYMVKTSAMQKPQRRQLMGIYGAEVIMSPSNLTQSGRDVLAKDPTCPGALGIAISEAVEMALKDAKTHYALGSVLNHVCLHQTVIGQEALLQMEKIGEKPDMVMSCVGGGSNFAGLAFPFVGKCLRGEMKDVEFVCVEPKACPTLTKGRYAYDFGDTAHFTPLMKQYTLGNNFMPPSIHSGGLRYHGMNSLVSKLVHDGKARAAAVSQVDVFKSAIDFARSEIILPAPESAHTIAQVVKEALKCKETGEEKVILFNISGHGNYDMAAYDNYREGNIVDVEYTEEMLNESFKSIPQIKGIQ